MNKFHKLNIKLYAFFLVIFLTTNLNAANREATEMELNFYNVYSKIYM